MAKVGRNILCSCGSGKKYKKCCFLKPHSNSKEGPFYAKVLDEFLGLDRDVHEKHLYPYLDMLDTGADCFSCAYDDFLLENDLNEPSDDRHKDVFYAKLFIPWMLFHWTPCEHLKKLPGFDGNETIAINYLNAFGDRLNSAEKRFIEKKSQTYNSFYRVQKVIVGESFVLKDILLEKTYTVQAYEPTIFLKPGDAFYGGLLAFDSHHFLVSMSTFILMKELQAQVETFKAFLKKSNVLLTEKSLRESLELEVRELFFILMQTHFCEEMKALCDADRKRPVYTKSFFELDLVPEAAFYRLMPLTLSEAPEVFLAEAKRDKAGKVVQIKVDWLVNDECRCGDCENTLMGCLTLAPGQLLLETSSEDRADMGQEVIKKLLGDAVSLEKITKENPEDLEASNTFLSLIRMMRGKINQKE